MKESNFFISKATQRNWDKLQHDGGDRLTSRANKSRSQKIITPEGYVMAGSLPRFVEELRDTTYPIDDLIYTLCASYIEHNRVSEANKNRFFAEYTQYQRLGLSVPRQILKNRQDDWIGFIYQSLTTEGSRILKGLYYTKPVIVSEMLSDIHVLSGERFLDPCCGSGIFLLKVEHAELEQLYGIDNDPLAVMIAKTNLMVKYNASTVYPQIYQMDFLQHAASALGDLKFDYIVTNPPWGTEKGKLHHSETIHSKEKASLFFTESFKFLNKNGIQHFLLPSSLMKIKVHADLRRFVTHETRMESIKCYRERFKGVFTDFISLKVSKKPVFGTQNYTVTTENNTVSRKEFKPREDDFCAIPMLNDRDEAIISKVERQRHDDLSHSRWALGIITGNNAKVLKERPAKGLERIYTGKDIGKYRLRPASRYIKYHRPDFQQCAKDEFYRAPEKLVYKFVSSHLCFAYDNAQSLFLNSANILIPEVDGMSIKTVMAFLNSSLFNFLYVKRFGDLKILKGNLSALPFPKITEDVNAKLSALVDEALKGDVGAVEEIDKVIFDLYQFDTEETKIISELQ
ncbi:MAG: N-6 DNA methylase [Bacteroidales bacterium]|nr:N-6 DNA methylase [Bacteroidales bacterium]